MNKSKSFFTRSMSALVMASAVAVFFAQPVAAQTAKKLQCTGCVKSKQLKNNGIKSKDIKNGQVKNADLGNNAVTSGKIADGAVTNSDLANGGVNGAKVKDSSLTGTDIRDGSIGPADLAPGTALGLSGMAVIPAADFRSDGIDPDDSYFFFGGGFQQGNSNNAGGGCIMAPAHLPDGATIREFEAFVVDSDAVGNVKVDLRRSNYVDGGAAVLASVTTTGSSSAVQGLSDTTINDPVVDLSTYAYYVTTCLGSADIKLYAARVFVPHVRRQSM